MNENIILSTTNLLELNNKNSKDTIIKSLVEGENPEKLMLEIYNIASNTIKCIYTIYLVSPNIMQFLAFEGKNGYGDFLYDDMQNIFECMKKIRKLQDVHSIWVQEMDRDTCDDVSCWNICIECYY